jgi:hypothetical protein
MRTAAVRRLETRQKSSLLVAALCMLAGGGGRQGGCRFQPLRGKEPHMRYVLNDALRRRGLRPYIIRTISTTTTSISAGSRIRSISNIVLSTRQKKQKQIVIVYHISYTIFIGFIIRCLV